MAPPIRLTPKRKTSKIWISYSIYINPSSQEIICNLASILDVYFACKI